MSIALKSGGPVKVFLDRNVSARSVIIEGAIQSQRVQWGPIEQEVEITGWQRKPLRDGDARWIADEVTGPPVVHSPRPGRRASAGRAVRVGVGA